MGDSHEHHQKWRRLSASTLILALLASTTCAQKSKKGLAYIGDTHIPDNRLLSSPESPLSWYYNWSPYPNTNLIPADSLEFVPMIHGIDATQSSQTEQAINRLPQSSTHILSFNEPDGTKSSGGSSITPEDAAKAYIEYIVPYRNGEKGGGKKWKISQPSVTGSPNGLNWLRSFNESCYKIDPRNGCPADFVAAHWYGDFDGLTSWLGSLDEYYNKNTSRSTPIKVWVTEMALPQQSVKDTIQMMNRTIPYLNRLDYVEKYAWFGAFRTSDANPWTGKGVALFDGSGGLTSLGAMYLGNGFVKGQKGPGEGVASGMRANMVMTVALCVCATFFVML